MLNLNVSPPPWTRSAMPSNAARSRASSGAATPQKPPPSTTSSPDHSATARMRRAVSPCPALPLPPDTQVAELFRHARHVVSAQGPACAYQ